MMRRTHPDFTTPHPGEEGHVWETPCFANAKWCRIHQYPDWTSGQLEHSRYPGWFVIADGYYTTYDGFGSPINSGTQWREVKVWCGPSAFYPSRGFRGKP
jgi:hypothetical protein